jgi:hypothetical protein
VAGGGSARACAADDGAAAAAAAGGAVYHAAEVNLVLADMLGTTPHLISTVIPTVPLDMVTYSSYDCMGTRLFPACLDWIRSKHNRTAASPAVALAIAEFGVPEMTEPQRVLPVIANVVSAVLSESAPGVRRAAVAFYWELFNNEVHGEAFPGGRCNQQTGPSFNASEQGGFWLVRPNMTRTPAWDYFAGLIDGSVPPPPPIKPPTWTRRNDSDVAGNNGGAVVPLPAGSNAADCEMPCLADEACTAVVFWQDQCFIKYGGAPAPAPGRVLLSLNA